MVPLVTMVLDMLVRLMSAFSTLSSLLTLTERGDKKKKVLRAQVICYHFQVLRISINTFSSASPTLKVPGYNLMMLALKKHRHRSATVSSCGSD